MVAPWCHIRARHAGFMVFFSDAVVNYRWSISRLCPETRQRVLPFGNHDLSNELVGRFDIPRFVERSISTRSHHPEVFGEAFFKKLQETLPF
ncbi:hypothetical protein NO263_13895 [Gluconacetobacter entanii]|uniref:Uncharacterized protein n=1 Tax=Gluconacetobacter entanii TaxID=108528 RepID=A0ABT3K8G5_9PROT|nr:hypothetical protein [Gluconacetobacter entanii]MBE7619112.1 hypothetical protein [Komagataeibacter sp. FXV2]MCW4591673.1 hypothetical protein [Gluconacetobacter entanii]MCW4595283.1 hypothetical protein [Gluconacetobacter entanii]NPC87734.1 hypothetical protein [Gluconacetobacter entanii]